MKYYREYPLGEGSDNQIAFITRTYPHPEIQYVLWRYDGNDNSVPSLYIGPTFSAVAANNGWHDKDDDMPTRFKSDTYKNCFKEITKKEAFVDLLLIG